MFVCAPQVIRSIMTTTTITTIAAAVHLSLTHTHACIPCALHARHMCSELHSERAGERKSSHSCSVAHYKLLQQEVHIYSNRCCRRRRRQSHRRSRRCSPRCSSSRTTRIYCAKNRHVSFSVEVQGNLLRVPAAARGRECVSAEQLFPPRLA